MRFPLQYCFISRPRSSTDFLPLPLNIRRQSRNPVTKRKRQRCVCVSLGSMRQIRHTSAWRPRTDRTVWTPGAEGTGEASVLLGGHAHRDGAWSLAGQGGGGRGPQGCNPGLGTHTRGGDVLSSYVYYYFFFQQSCKRQSVTLNSMRRACRWVGKEPFS